MLAGAVEGLDQQFEIFLGMVKEELLGSIFFKFKIGKRRQGACGLLSRAVIRNADCLGVVAFDALQFIVDLSAGFVCIRSRQQTYPFFGGIVADGFVKVTRDIRVLYKMGVASGSEAENVDDEDRFLERRKTVIGGCVRHLKYIFFVLFYRKMKREKTHLKGVN